jgi:hypothetical protein
LRAWRQRSIARGYKAKNLQLTTPPPNSEPMLPEQEPERRTAALVAHTILPHLGKIAAPRRHLAAVARS